jgi:hypothetical protein
VDVLLSRGELGTAPNEHKATSVMLSDVYASAVRIPATYRQVHDLGRGIERSHRTRDVFPSTLSLLQPSVLFGCLPGLGRNVPARQVSA